MEEVGRSAGTSAEDLYEDAKEYLRINLSSLSNIDLFVRMLKKKLRPRFFRLRSMWLNRIYFIRMTYKSQFGF